MRDAIRTSNGGQAMNLLRKYAIANGVVDRDVTTPSLFIEPIRGTTRADPTPMQKADKGSRRTRRAKRRPVHHGVFPPSDATCLSWSLAESMIP